ncbi:hypothetical protein ACQYE5_002485 [Enterobacter cancerogenus]
MMTIIGSFYPGSADVNGEKIPDADIHFVRIRYQEQGIESIAVQSVDNVIPGNSITSTLKAF